MDLSKFSSNLIPRCAAAWQLTLTRWKNTHSSNQWLDRQRRDPFVKRAVKENYRARSAFKLIALNDRFKLMQPGDVVVDLGASPGSWSQVAIKLVNANAASTGGGGKPRGLVISVDREFIEDLGPGARVLSHCDITDSNTVEMILKELDNKKANCVISDMAPNATGQVNFDHDAIISLQKSAFKLAQKILAKNGNFLCKIWFGDSTNNFRDELLESFERVKLVKPEASRTDSSEIFLVCSNFKKN